MNFVKRFNEGIPAELVLFRGVALKQQQSVQSLFLYLLNQLRVELRDQGRLRVVYDAFLHQGQQ
uniref:Uncharacterized protein n=1 Tax=Anopheles albimanus TaxID=7167 RepID=A0A182FY46_ANOAL